MTAEFLFTTGPQGRGVFVDASGRLITNSDLGAGPLVYSFGTTGRPLSVDASGRLLVNVSGLNVGEVNVGENLGSGSGIYAGKSGVNLQFKTFVAGDNVTITGSGNTLIVASSGGGGGGGETNTASNVGTGASGFKQKTGVDLEFRSFVAGSGIEITENTNDLTFKSATPLQRGASVINPASGEQTFTAPRVNTEYTILSAHGYRRGGTDSGWDVLKNGATIFAAGSIQNTPTADTWNTVSPTVTTLSYSDTLQVVINASGLADEIVVSVDLQINN